jgi:hypothetical protein
MRQTILWRAEAQLKFGFSLVGATRPSVPVTLVANLVLCPVIASSAANQYDHAISAHGEFTSSTGMTHPEDVETREPVLDTVDRISELCFARSWR